VFGLEAKQANLVGNSLFDRWPINEWVSSKALTDHRTPSTILESKLAGSGEDI